MVNNRYAGLATFTFLVFATSCAQDSGSKPKPVATSTATGSAIGASNATNQTTECTSLRSNPPLKADVLSASHIDKFCNTDLLAKLRANGTLQISSTQQGTDSSMELYAGFNLNPGVSAKSYINMIKLQLGDPTKFKTEQFETDLTLVNTPIQPVTSDVIRYNLLSNKEDITVEYEATVSFATLAVNTSYAIFTKCSLPKQTIKSCSGLQLVNTTSAGVVEVLFSSSQSFDNMNDHQTGTTKSARAFQEEIDRYKRNSVNASKADKYFQ